MPVLDCRVPFRPVLLGPLPEGQMADQALVAPMAIPPARDGATVRPADEQAGLVVGKRRGCKRADTCGALDDAFDRVAT